METILRFTESLSTSSGFGRFISNSFYISTACTFEMTKSSRELSRGTSPESSEGFVLRRRGDDFVCSVLLLLRTEITLYHFVRSCSDSYENWFVSDYCHRPVDLVMTAWDGVVVKDETEDDLDYCYCLSLLSML